MEDLKHLVLEKAIEASQAIKKIDPDLHRFWNLVIAKKRLYIVKESDGREEKKVS